MGPKGCQSEDVTVRLVWIYFSIFYLLGPGADLVYLTVNYDWLLGNMQTSIKGMPPKKLQDDLGIFPKMQ